ncbi:tetratricopeptide repeat protein [Verrucomicrobia bacterium S94]|nr:tetratricopeptide repeat protein [Verrucomicrobia bacterium S94]
MNVRLFLGMLLSGMLCRGETYEQLSSQLKNAVEKQEIHRLKSQIAGAAIGRLETGTLSKKDKKKLRAQIKDCCADVQLGSMDVWYGESVVTWGRLLLLDGKWKEARMQLLDQAEVLQNIERNLKANAIPVSSISPVAGCRYILGETYREEYERFQTLESAVEAFRHFYNVYIKYSDGPWGEKAQAAAEAMQAELERHGKQVRIDLGSHKDSFIAAQFRLGSRRMAEERYADAVEAIETAINYFPETVKSVQALRNLAVCKQELGRPDEVYMIAEYCCERFAADTNAPIGILSLGRRAVDAGNEELGEQLFQLYLTTFPEHEKRADILSWFAWRAYEAEEMEEAMSFFQLLESELRRFGEAGERLEKVVYLQATMLSDLEKLDDFLVEFPRSKWAAQAMSEKAQALLVAGDFEAAFQTLETLEEDFPEAAASKKALAGLIVAAVDAGRFNVAEQVLGRMLEDQDAYGHDVYLATGEGLLSAEQFALAEKAFAAVPDDERAVFGAAACKFGIADFEGSFRTLEALLEDYPDTGRFYDARLMQARCLVELGRTNAAVAAYSEAARENYAVTLEMAGVLSDPEEKLSAYQRVALLADPEHAEHQPLIAESIMQSLPLCMELGKYELVLDACDQFTALFPEHKQSQVVRKYRKEAERALAD